MSLGPLMIDLKGPSLDADERRWLASPLVGGVILFKRNYQSREQLEALVADIHAVRSPPLVVTVDHEGGRVQRFREGFTQLPPMRVLGHLYDEDPSAALRAAGWFGWLMAAELRAVGIDMSFAPCVDRDLGLAAVIGDRALHPEASVVARLALRFASGAKRAGMAITAKHFPTHAGAVADSHTDLAVDRREYVDLEDDLYAYRRLIDAGLSAVMAAHVSFPAVDPTPASSSSWWINECLRGELRFRGCVISDDVSMAGAAAGGSTRARVRASLDAGCDVVLVCNAPHEVPGVLEDLRGYASPAGQVRWARLHGRAGEPWHALTASAEWRTAVAVLEGLAARPELTLHAS